MIFIYMRQHDNTDRALPRPSKGGGTMVVNARSRPRRLAVPRDPNPRCYHRREA